MAGYGIFAEFYDGLTLDVGYDERTDYLLRLFDKFGSRPKLLLDLACGTGGFSFEMLRRGIEVIGVDCSAEMLSEARAKAGEDDRLLLVCQDAAALDLYSSVDGAICCLDSINHFENFEAVKSAFEGVFSHLEKDGLFIFDINSLYKHREVLGNNTFVYDTDDVYLVWQNELDENERDVHIYLDFFKPESGIYERYSEDFSEKGYTVDEIKKSLTEVGFKVVAVYNDMTEQPFEEDSERIIFVAKK